MEERYPHRIVPEDELTHPAHIQAAKNARELLAMKPTITYPKKKKVQDRRSRLHNALDCVMDRVRAKDGQWSIPPEALTKSARQILDLWKRGKDMHAIGRETGYGFEFVRQVLRDQGVA